MPFDQQRQSTEGLKPCWQWAEMIAIIWCYGRIHHGNFLKWQRKVKHLPQFIEVSTNISVALASRLQQLRTWAKCGPKYTLRIFQKTCTLHYYATGSATAKFTCPTSLKVITYHELFLDQIFVLLFHLSYTDMHFTSNVQQQCAPVYSPTSTQLNQLWITDTQQTIFAINTITKALTAN